MQAVVGQKLVASLKAQEREYEVRDVTLKGFLVRVHPSGRMTYSVQYGRGRKFTIGRVGTLTPAEARDRARQVLADAAKGIDPMETKRKAKTHTLESYITGEYAPWVEAHHGDGTATIRMIKANFFPTLGKLRLDDITPWQVEKWRSERLKAGARPSTLNRYVNPLKAALRRAVDWDLIAEHPLTKVKPLRTDTRGAIRYLSDDEEGRLAEALDRREERMRRERDSANEWRRIRGYEELPELDGFADHIKPMVILSLNTGLRRGELFKLKWSDVDLNRAMLTVRGEGAKSGQTRHVPLNEAALETLNKWREQSKADLVFPGKNGERLTNVKTVWANLMKDAEITAFRWHDMRHDFASKLVMAGVDLNTVRELLGHADIKMTLRYAHLAPAVKAEAVGRLVRGEAWQRRESRSCRTASS